MRLLPLGLRLPLRRRIQTNDQYREQCGQLAMGAMTPARFPMAFCILPQRPAAAGPANF